MATTTVLYLVVLPGCNLNEPKNHLWLATDKSISKPSFLPGSWQTSSCRLLHWGNLGEWLANGSVLRCFGPQNVLLALLTFSQKAVFIIVCFFLSVIVSLCIKPYITHTHAYIYIIFVPVRVYLNFPPTLTRAGHFPTFERLVLPHCVFRGNSLGDKM